MQAAQALGLLHRVHDVVAHLHPDQSGGGKRNATGATLSWTASSGATSYNIQASTNSGFSSGSLTINQTGFAGTSDPITGLTAGTTYYWQVSATNAGGTSSWAVPSPAAFITVPVAPTNLRQGALRRQSATLSWTGIERSDVVIAIAVSINSDISCNSKYDRVHRHEDR